MTVIKHVPSKRGMMIINQVISVVSIFSLLLSFVLVSSFKH